MAIGPATDSSESEDIMKPFTVVHIDCEEFKIIVDHITARNIDHAVETVKAFRKFEDVVDPVVFDGHLTALN